MDQAERFNKQIEVIDVALDRLAQLVGGYTFEGKALAPSGDIEEGTFAAFGPSVYFASGSTELTGVAITKLNAAEAAIANPGNGYAENIRQLVTQGEGSVPADATLGKALKIVEGHDSIGEHIAKGGGVGYVIIALGLACLAVGLLKVQEITSFKTADPDEVLSVIRSIEDNDMKAAQNAAAAISGAGGTLLQTGVDIDGGSQEILYEKILAVRPKLERFLPYGAHRRRRATAWSPRYRYGMIKTFNLITIFGTGDARASPLVSQKHWSPPNWALSSQSLR